MQKRFLAVLVCGIAALLVGCGGGSGGGSAVGTGRAVFNIAWPAASRLVPIGANSVKITLVTGSNAPLTQTAARPQPAITFTGLPPAQFTATVETFASTDATGTAITTSSVPVAVAASATTTSNLDPEVAINSLVSDFAVSDVVPGQAVTVHLTGSGASNAVVPLTGRTITWTSSDATKVTVSASGVITGVAGGSAVITATDTLSGKHIDIPVVCLTLTGPDGTPTVGLSAAHTFTVSLIGPTDASVTWSVLEGTNGGTIDAGGIYTAPLTPGTYHVVATSVYDTARKVTIPVTVIGGGIDATIN